MIRRRTLGVVAATMITVSALGGGVTPVLAAKHYDNCTKLQKVYPHGVGKPGAKDKVNGRYQAGKSVTNFKKSTALYNANKDKDRDGDGVACEKR